MNTETHDFVMVTNHKPVDIDDFYLSDKWKANISGNIGQLRKLAKEGRLFHAWVVGARDYLIYRQMDAHHIIVDEDNTEVISCESDVIGNKHEEVQSYDF